MNRRQKRQKINRLRHEQHARKLARRARRLQLREEPGDVVILADEHGWTPPPPTVGPLPWYAARGRYVAALLAAIFVLCLGVVLGGCDAGCNAEGCSAEELIAAAVAGAITYLLVRR